ncbi:sulfurtransferase [Myxosarcina sp. GI1]|uniref:sulfurtransferase n=1 Tax=Myxosarcina sp. GI1 TaxID=1541065 RepID=UPI0005685376|nr:sulfurtransferase [Myxosarcina sp. GI1]
MSDYTHPELVTTDWLAHHLEDPRVRIIEMDLNPEAYQRGHLPGSVFWDGTAPMKPNFQIDFEPTAIEQLMAKSGVDNHTTVVAVHGNFTATSGFIFWLLKVIGHADVRILDGGRQKWIEDGYPLTTEKTVIEPTNYQVKSFDNNLRVLLPQVEESLHDSNTVILDVRTPQEYSGEVYMMNPPTADERGGHIPGAISLYYELAHNKDGTFKSVEQLREIYSSKGITPDKLIIPYCAVGARSAHTWFILKYLLGYPKVKNYDGSWNEWSRTPDLPVEK